jgi:surface protein
MTTLINNDNLRELVVSYIFDKSGLPDDLRDVSIGDWDVSNVTDMKGLFQFDNFDDDDGDAYELFNEPLNNWNVSRVTDMSEMFSGCTNFNQPLNNWNVSNVGNIYGMFIGCANFNQPLNGWIVSRVTDITEMFSGCTIFNQPLNNWNVSNVEKMYGMFRDCANFNQPLNGWDVSLVTDMSEMFSGCTNFNQQLNDWDVSNVENMYGMFIGCANFNQPLNGWIVSKVEDMEGMFIGCTNFNQPLNGWNVSKVKNMDYMFSGCTNFNQQLNGWDVSNVENMYRIFENCGISEENKPDFNVQNVQNVEVDALQVHTEAAKINYAKLNAFLKEKLNNVTIPEDMNYSLFINQKITQLINESGNTEETRVQQRNDLRRIITERLSGLNYEERSILVRESIFYGLNYVLEQPNTFKQMYLHTFFQDCIHAYEGEDGMTCANGALERILFSLVPACATEETNSDYETIISIITANPIVLIPIYIRDWYKLHKTGTPDAFPSGTPEEEMKSNLKTYLLEKFPNENTLIDQKIVEYADSIGYDEESFMYGGKRRNRIINKRKTKKGKTKKRKTKKRNQPKKIKKPTKKARKCKTNKKVKMYKSRI